MGRMKEVFMQMREDEWLGTDTEYIKHYVEKYIKTKDVYIPQPCPNCNSEKLLFNALDDVECQENGCGQKFIMTDMNTLRYA
jgi:hypothetical protein